MHYRRFSPAKINTHLEVVSRREDGFHDLFLTFLELDWGDEVQFTPGPVNRIEINGKQWEYDDNLIGKAVDWYNHRFKTDIKGEWLVNKKIPMGGGLGGGSSNAASAIEILRYIEKRDLTAQDIEASVDIGADVPFFLIGGYALGVGKGEVLEALEAPSQEILLGLAPWGMATKDVFTYLANSRQKKYNNPSGMTRELLQNPKMANNWFNDLEKPATKINDKQNAVMNLLHQMYSPCVDEVVLGQLWLFGVKSQKKKIKS